MNITQYDTETYPFVKILIQFFGVENLDELHTKTNILYDKQFEVGKDSSTIFHLSFYTRLKVGWEELEKVYEKFIAEVVAPKNNETFLYQKFPTFRAHLPGNVAVGAFHNDSEFNHPNGETNYILPLTNSSDTASVWVESEPGKKDFTAIDMKVGDLIEFDGNHLTHGNKQNLTGKTRVSFDFRILPISKYKEVNSGQSVTLGTKFKEGEYYKKFVK